MQEEVWPQCHRCLAWVFVRERSSWSPCATRCPSPEPSLQQGQHEGSEPFPFPLEKWGLSQGELHSSGGYKITLLIFGRPGCSGGPKVPPHLCCRRSISDSTAVVGSWGCSEGPWAVPLPCGGWFSSSSSVLVSRWLLLPCSENCPQEHQNWSSSLVSSASPLCRAVRTGKPAAFILFPPRS